MIKDKNRLIAEKSISVIQEFKRLEDFLNLFEQYQKDEFINYELIEAIGYIGIISRIISLSFCENNMACFCLFIIDISFSNKFIVISSHNNVKT